MAKTEEQKTEAAAEPAMIEGRVLCAFDGWQVGDVAELTEAEAEQAAADGRIDPHPDAVAYAKAASAETAED
jgi:hypothetical protein